jgi:hypothetical protein
MKEAGMEAKISQNPRHWLTTLNIWLSVIAGVLLLQRLLQWYVTGVFADHLPPRAHVTPIQPACTPFFNLLPMLAVILSRSVPPRGRAGRILLLSAIASFGTMGCLLASYDPIPPGPPPPSIDTAFAWFFGLAFAQMLVCVVWDARYMLLDRRP